ncbi:hypothetical protein ABQF17_24295 [Mycolicibacterium elephantis]|uniref:hypothetical protein n=1 Tax=Mycolicibacterium elephantis TaxID=81858 RepID=UPI0007EA7386|nr:hypothetical protein [Mycolicibacterium elephantis]OBA76320.1 hypothetical protein A5633_19010 [Mycolicibacterium elephantis]
MLRVANEDRGTATHDLALDEGVVDLRRMFAPDPSDFIGPSGIALHMDAFHPPRRFLDRRDDDAVKPTATQFLRRLHQHLLDRIDTVQSGQRVADGGVTVVALPYLRLGDLNPQPPELGEQFHQLGRGRGQHRDPGLRGHRRQPFVGRTEGGQYAGEVATVSDRLDVLASRQRRDVVEHGDHPLTQPGVAQRLADHRPFLSVAPAARMDGPQGGGAGGPALGGDVAGGSRHSHQR